MILWIARDVKGELELYDRKPNPLQGWFFPQMGFGRLKLNEQLFPEVTFENSPQEVELKLVK